MIRVQDLAYVRYRTPDPGQMETFLVDFGLRVSARMDDAVYLRGAARDHHFVIVERNDVRGFTGLAFKAESEGDLEKAAEIEGASPVESIEEPGGGRRVRLIDPTGYQVEIVHGIGELDALPVRRAMTYNMGPERRRTGVTQRPEAGPSTVLRLGHCVLRVRDYRACLAFYEKIGLAVSDEVYDGTPENVVVGFLHCDRGETYTDHHTIGLAARPGPIAVDHTAFEVIDMDDVVIGGAFLASKGYFRSWGVGRHWLGSQIFDYWRDANGFKFEHWTDGDLVNDSHVVTREQVAPTGPGALSQWGLMEEDHVRIYPGTESVGPVSS